MAHSTLPDDLAQAQYDWGRTCTALAAAHPRGTTALRRRLLHLSSRLFWHPFWSIPAGHSTAARAALSQLVRAHAQGRDAP
ncbi:hypothetical protein AR457_38750 [Streptomyces agglomeratus]|uniref:hypothetical protein n=1 Tax=Streptomyces agglomeratus TaxID=285458 RepID=UPI0008545624|nr:hypothetical protein [Streptomyces agglomeratus]OEJ21888.1 hypothetical protein AR457_38750 [Streptomyces agglomeratus]OEJ49554.1 hypothetical protein BGK72_00715 [Streptomyces agglomeratus]